MNEWTHCLLGSIAEVQTGPFGSQLKNEQYITGGTPVITVEHINAFRIKNIDYPSISEDDRLRLKKYSLSAGDIVFTRVGSVDLSAYVNPENEGWLFSSRMLRVRVVSKIVDSRFLSYFFRQDKFREYILNIAVGATMPSINTQILKDVPVAYPPLPEQKAIASVLSSLDDKIDLLHRQNKTLEAMAETLFRQWFIEEASEDWEDGVLGDIASNVRANATTEAIDPNEVYVGLEHIERRHIALSQHGYGSDVSSNKSRFKKHDILFGKLRPYFHKVCITQFEGVCSTDILVLRAQDKDWIAFTLFAFFQDSVIEYANLASGGTRMPRADWGSLSQYPIAIPPLELVDQFNKVTMPSIEKIHKNLTQIQTLEQLRDTLLPKLMNGEVRVQHQTEQVA